MKKLQRKINRLELERNSANIESELNQPIYAPASVPFAMNPMNSTPPLQNFEENNFDQQKIHHFLSSFDNLDERAINTERRVMELEMQLDKMRRLLDKEVEKNPILNNIHRSEHIYEKNNKRINNIESDATLRDAEQDFSKDDLQEQQDKRDETRVAFKSQARVITEILTVVFCLRI